jgi:glycerol kinase
MSGPFLLALDLGTSGVRALVVGGDGRVASRAYQPLGTRYPTPGRVEQDPREIWERSLEVMNQALTGAALGAADIAALGVVTQRSTVLAWDSKTGEPLAPAVGWQDQRTAPRVAELRKLGIPINTMPSATKFEWWMRNEPAVQEAASAGRLCLGNPDAWLTFKLTGGLAHVTDPGQASCTALFNLHEGQWNPLVLQVFGLEEAVLPRVVATSEVVGETPPKLLGAAIPVAARAGDQQAASFAQGVHHPGEAKLTLGTAAMLDLHLGTEPGELDGGLFPLALWRLAGEEDAQCLEGSVVTAGAAVDWLVSLGLLPDAASLDRVAGGAESAEGVAFVPALQGLGAPFLDMEARGLLGGLTRGSGAPQIARAVIDGIAHRCVDVCDALELDDRPLRVDGGLGRSELLLQRLADLGGRALLRAEETETTALGAAHLAGLATGVFATPAACRELHGSPQRFEPTTDPGWRAAARSRWNGVLERARGDTAEAG